MTDFPGEKIRLWEYWMRMAPALATGGAVLPVLNGINHITVLSDRLGALPKDQEIVFYCG